MSVKEEKIRTPQMDAFPPLSRFTAFIPLPVAALLLPSWLWHKGLEKSFWRKPVWPYLTPLVTPVLFLLLFSLFSPLPVSGQIPRRAYYPWRKAQFIYQTLSLFMPYAHGQPCTCWLRNNSHWVQWGLLSRKHAQDYSLPQADWVSWLCIRGETGWDLHPSGKYCLYGFHVSTNLIRDHAVRILF